MINLLFSHIIQGKVTRIGKLRSDLEAFLQEDYSEGDTTASSLQGDSRSLSLRTASPEGMQAEVLPSHSEKGIQVPSRDEMEAEDNFMLPPINELEQKRRLKKEVASLNVQSLDKMPKFGEEEFARTERSDQVDDTKQISNELVSSNSNLMQTLGNYNE